MKPNIYEYPIDISLLPAYRIAVMQAAMDGMVVEWRSRIMDDAKDWQPLVNQPSWNWRDSDYRIAKPIYPKDCMVKWPSKPTTVIGWLLTLPQPYRTLAIRNLFECRADNPCQSLSQAIGDGFGWADSPERWDFWQRLTWHYTGCQTPLPLIPEPKKLVPWNNSTAPLPCIIRHKQNHSERHQVLVAECRGVVFIRKMETRQYTYGYLLEQFEHSIDGGKTWLPCGTEE